MYNHIMIEIILIIKGIETGFSRLTTCELQSKVPEATTQSRRLSGHLLKVVI